MLDELAAAFEAIFHLFSRLISLRLMISKQIRRIAVEIAARSTESVRKRELLLYREARALLSDTSPSDAQLKEESLFQKHSIISGFHLISFYSFSKSEMQSLTSNHL